MRVRLLAVICAAAASGCMGGPAGKEPLAVGVFIRQFTKPDKTRIDHLRIEDRCASALAENALLVKDVRLVAPESAGDAREIGTRWELYCEEKGRTLEVATAAPDVEFGGSVSASGASIELRGYSLRGESRNELAVEGEVNSAADADLLSREFALRLLCGCFPGDVRLLMKLGVVLSQGGLPSRAIDAYRKVLAQDPGNAAAHFNIGVAYDRLGEIDAANAAYAKAVEARPDYYQALFNMGLNDVGQRREGESEDQMRLRFQRGAALFKRVVEINPRHKDARHMLAETLDMIERRTEALDECAEIIRMFPADASAHRLAGSICLELHRAQEALAFFRKAAELEPLLVSNDFWIASALEALGQTDAAADHLRRFIDLAGMDEKFARHVQDAMKKLANLEQNKGK